MEVAATAGVRETPSSAPSTVAALEWEGGGLVTRGAQADREEDALSLSWQRLWFRCGVWVSNPASNPRDWAFQVPLGKVPLSEPVSSPVKSGEEGHLPHWVSVETEAGAAQPAVGAAPSRQ